MQETRHEVYENVHLIPKIEHFSSADLLERYIKYQKYSNLYFLAQKVHYRRVIKNIDYD